jgi:hypothetical protein
MPPFVVEVLRDGGDMKLVTGISATASDTNDLSQSARTAGILGLLYRCHCHLDRLREDALATAASKSDLNVAIPH